jgi:hypothetical protein
MRGLFATEKMPATAHVGIDGFIDPCEFEADLVDVGIGAPQMSSPLQVLFSVYIAGAAARSLRSISNGRQSGAL